MAWLLLAMTIVFEVLGTTMMKLSNGFTHLWPSIGVFLCYAVSLAGITLVLKHMELSIAYAIWSGAGTALTAMIGIYMFREPATGLKLASLFLVIAGVVGLQLAASMSKSDSEANATAAPLDPAPAAVSILEEPAPASAYTRM